jgi:hypothetical protein
MTGRKLLSLLVISFMLTGCATSQLRIVPAPSEAPINPTVMVGSDYPEPGSIMTVTKIPPYPESGALPAEQPMNSPTLPSLVANPATIAAPSWEPQPGDDQLTHGNIYIDNQQILTLESFPPQFMLEMKGNLPTPCHTLRVKVDPPNASQQIQVDVYSLAKPDEICVQMLQAFQVSVPLKDLPPGTYEVLVNMQPVGELTVP